MNKTPTTKVPVKKASAKKTSSKKAASPSGLPASALIDARIAGLGDWRGEMLANLRAVIKAADPGVTEEWKWSVPVWSHDGIVCTGETYQKVVKTTFAKGCLLAGPLPALQFQPRRQYPASHRFPRGRHAGRKGAEGAR